MSNSSPGAQDANIGNPSPEIGALVRTACNGQVRYTADMPYASFHGETVIFCLPICKEDFERDPFLSCMAGRLLALG
jgi:hypothetical protein